MCRRGPHHKARRTRHSAAEALAEFDTSELTTGMLPGTSTVAINSKRNDCQLVVRLADLRVQEILIGAFFVVWNRDHDTLDAKISRSLGVGSARRRQAAHQAGGRHP